MKTKKSEIKEIIVLTLIELCFPIYDLIRNHNITGITFIPVVVSLCVVLGIWISMAYYRIRIYNMEKEDDINA